VSDGEKLDILPSGKRFPILDKDTLRKFSHAELLEAFCAVPGDQIAEYWRQVARPASPSSIRAPLDDLRYGELSLGDARFPASALARASFVTSRSARRSPGRPSLGAERARMFGVGMVWGFGAEQFIRGSHRAARSDPDASAAYFIGHGARLRLCTRQSGGSERHQILPRVRCANW